MTTIAALLAELSAAGVELRVVGERLHYRSRSGLTGGLRAALEEHKNALLQYLGRPGEREPEIAWRVTAMRAQLAALPTGTPLPFLIARPTPRTQGGCLSCGAPLQQAATGVTARCHPCLLAVWQVLKE